MQLTLPRNFSDHCPILLRAKSVDWGPKSFRILDCWLTDKSFKATVLQSWKSDQPHQPVGWGAYILKEKFKRLKIRLKKWNQEQFGDTFKKVTKLESDLNKLEEDSMHRQLTEQEKLERKQL